MNAMIRTVATAPVSTPIGAYDILGDVHGCWEEMAALLTRAGWQIDPAPTGCAPFSARHPAGRLLIFAGDLTDRGPASDLVLRQALGMLAEGTALWVTGNHDWKLARLLKGNPVHVAGGLDRTLAQIADFPQALKDHLRDTLFALPHQVRLAMPEGHERAGDGFLTVVHGAAPAHHQDRETVKAFERAIYGYPAGLTEEGHVRRDDWAASYDGERWVVHGHEPFAAPRLINRVLNIDTGCVFGGALTLYRADTMEILSEPARADHAGKGRVLT